MPSLTRRWGVAAALLLAGCSHEPPAPPSPGAAAVWSDPQRPGVSFTVPSNWPVTLRDGTGGTRAILVQASPAELLVLVAHGDRATTPLETFAAEVEAKAAEAHPGLTLGPPTAVSVAGRATQRVEFSVRGADRRGVRYIVQGGWVVEYELRPAQAAIVTAPWERLIESLKLPD